MGISDSHRYRKQTPGAFQGIHHICRKRKFNESRAAIKTRVQQTAAERGKSRGASDLRPHTEFIDLHISGKPIEGLPICYLIVLWVMQCGRIMYDTCHAAN